MIKNLCFTDTDPYGRSIGDITLPDGRNLNQEVVRAGYAWHYVKYSDDASLAVLEKEARIARRGLWQDKDPMAPWEKRKIKEQKANKLNNFS